MEKNTPPYRPQWKDTLFNIIFESDTFAGKAFDVVLLIAILFSISLVILESITEYRLEFKNFFFFTEWFFTLLFTLEYILRLISVRHPLRYAFSFFGVIDFIAILPTYLGLLDLGINYFLSIRILRLMRIFRIFKLSEYLYEASIMQKAITASLKRIFVFLLAVLTFVIIIGAFIYAIEGSPNGFTDIPTSIYWAIVTLTTVGYGDIAPQTAVGKMLASIVMLLGYGMIAVPTGIVTVELSRISHAPPINKTCPYCSKDNHDSDALYCKYCGSRLL